MGFELESSDDTDLGSAEEVDYESDIDMAGDGSSSALPCQNPSPVLVVPDRGRAGRQSRESGQRTAKHVPKPSKPRAHTTKCPLPELKSAAVVDAELRQEVRLRGSSLVLHTSCLCCYS